MPSFGGRSDRGAQGPPRPQPIRSPRAEGLAALEDTACLVALCFGVKSAPVATA